MAKLDYFVIERKHITDRYNEMFLSKPIKIPFTIETAISSCHLYVARLDLVSLQASLKQVFDRMRSAGILVNLHYIPVYRHPYYEKFGYERRDYPVAEAYYSNAISLPIFPGLTIQQQEFAVKTLCTPTGNQVIF
jgi:dTDP-4-amino-4,6-dideoxygalactose transaminase